MKKCIGIAAILLVGALGFRLYLAIGVPNDEPDDGRVYAQIGRNVLDHHSYSIETEEPYTPTFIRVPGYPLFLAGVYKVFGENNNRAVRIAQAVLSTVTCLVIGLLAYAWAPADWSETRRRWALVLGVALAAVCPFTAIYVSVILTETWATLLAAASALAATFAMKSGAGRRKVCWWLLAGLLGGAATMFRPDAAMFVGAAGALMVLVQAARAMSGHRASPPSPHSDRELPGTARFQRALAATARRFGFPGSAGFQRARAASSPADGDQTSPARQAGPAAVSPAGPSAPISRWASPLGAALVSGVALTLGFALALAPWTIRNARVFSRFEPIAPADAGMPGEFGYQGYIAWLKTWVDDVRYTEAAEWPLDYAPIRIEKIPDSAFDSPDEKSQVAALLAAYNKGAQEPQSQDSANDSSDDDDSDTADSDNSSQDQQPQANQADQANQANQASANQVHSGPEYDVQMTPELDSAFREIARQRIARHPFRYYVALRAKRAASLWFDTHSQYYPFQGELLPLSGLDTDLHQQYWLPAFTLLTLLYTVLALTGGFIFWRHKEARIWLLFLALLFIPRIAFLSTLENPEPRYVVELFAFVAAAGAVALASMDPGWLRAKAASFIARRRDVGQASSLS